MSAVTDESLLTHSGYNFTANDIAGDNNKSLTYHKIIETFKYAYARRALLGDKDFANITKVSKIYCKIFDRDQMGVGSFGGEERSDGLRCVGTDY